MGCRVQGLELGDWWDTGLELFSDALLPVTQRGEPLLNSRVNKRKRVILKKKVSVPL
jgi:hypothetical protein